MPEDRSNPSPFPHPHEWTVGNGYRKQLVFSPEELQCPGALVQFVELGPGQAVPPHYHQEMIEVFHMLAGEGRMTIEGQSYDLKPGMTLACHPPQVHAAHNASEIPWRFIVFKTNAREGDLHWVREDAPSEAQASRVKSG